MDVLQRRDGDPRATRVGSGPTLACAAPARTALEPATGLPAGQGVLPAGGACAAQENAAAARSEFQAWPAGPPIGSSLGSSDGTTCALLPRLVLITSKGFNGMDALNRLGFDGGSNS